MISIPVDRERLRTWTRTARRVLFPPKAGGSDSVEAWADARALWLALFGVFRPETRDADVLELGCGDGRMLALVLAEGEARSAVGLDRRAFWNGEGAAAWRAQDLAGLQLMPMLEHLHGLNEEAFDLVLCRELDSIFDAVEINDGLSRLYGLLRPGGEAIVRVRCADLRADGFDGPGYGFMTPAAWTHFVLRAGFEIADSRAIPRDPAQAALARERLPQASEPERMTAELHLRLIRPWESWEIEMLGGFGPRPRAVKKRRRRRV